MSVFIFKENFENEKDWNNRNQPVDPTRFAKEEEDLKKALQRLQKAAEVDIEGLRNFKFHVPPSTLKIR